jgi:hypothetical protein
MIDMVADGLAGEAHGGGRGLERVLEESDGTGPDPRRNRGSKGRRALHHLGVNRLDLRRGLVADIDGNRPATRLGHRRRYPEQQACQPGSEERIQSHGALNA